MLTIAMTLIVCAVTSIALADDFTTNNGKEYKNATVTQVEADGIVVRTKVGISKLYFTELPEDVQKRFHYDPGKAAAAQAAAVQQTQEINRQAAETSRRLKTPIRACCNKRKIYWQKSAG
jgi:hypothetical protein